MDEINTTVREVEKWDPIRSPLNPPPEPYNSTFWGRLMHKGWWFELNLSSSNPVRVTVSPMTQEGPATPIFNQVGTIFTQKVKTGATDTYQIDIKNEGTSPADILGNVTAKEEITTYRTVYPYATPATLIAFAGATILVFGVLTKPKKLKSRK